MLTLWFAPPSPSCLASRPVALSTQPQRRPGPRSLEKLQLLIVLPASSWPSRSLPTNLSPDNPPSRPALPCWRTSSLSRVTSRGSGGEVLSLSPSYDKKS